MFEKLLKNNNTEKYVKDTNTAIEYLLLIISKKSTNLINIFRLDNDENDQDFELTILRAFLNGKCTLEDFFCVYRINKC